MQGLGANGQSCLGKRKYARRPEVMRVVSRHVWACLDMSEHVWTCPDTVDTGALHAKICSGDLSGSGLRKYALRQNHTIPVWLLWSELTHIK